MTSMVLNGYKSLFKLGEKFKSGLQDKVMRYAINHLQVQLWLHTKKTDETCMYEGLCHKAVVVYELTYSLCDWDTSRRELKKHYKIHLGYPEKDRPKPILNNFNKKLHSKKCLLQSCLLTYWFHDTDRIQHSLCIANNLQTNLEGLSDCNKKENAVKSFRLICDSPFEQYWLTYVILATFRIPFTGLLFLLYFALLFWWCVMCGKSLRQGAKKFGPKLEWVTGS
jgi:hypothetical protein